MNKLLFISILILIVFPVKAQDTCSPMKNGKICYSAEAKVEGVKQDILFDRIHTWAKKEYGKDIFLSNVSPNKQRGNILISSKIELLLNDTDSTQLKFKMNIACRDNGYSVVAKDIRYIYDVDKNKRFRTFNAENVIANEGKSNTVAHIKDPLLFCDATRYYFTTLFDMIHRVATTKPDR